MLMVTTWDNSWRECKPWVHTNSGDLRLIEYEIISKDKWDVVAMEK